jgi:hypothetical protein
MTIRAATVPNDTAKEIEAALLPELREQGLEGTACELIGSQNNTRVEVVVHPAGAETFSFKVAMEDALNGSLRRKIKLGLTARPR